MGYYGVFSKLRMLTWKHKIYSSIMEPCKNVVFMHDVIVYKYKYSEVDDNIRLHLYIPICCSQRSYDVFTRRFSSHEVANRHIIVSTRHCLDQKTIDIIRQDLDAGFISQVNVRIASSPIPIEGPWCLTGIAHRNAIDIKNDVISTKTLTENLQEKNMKKFDKFIVSGPVTVGKINGKDIKIRLHDGDESDPEKAILTLFAKSFFPNNSQYLKWMNEQMDLMRNAISAEETRLKKKGEKKPKKSNVAKAVAYGEVLSRLVDETHSTSKEPSCEEKCWKKCQQLQDYSRCGHCKYSYRCPSTANADWMEKVARYEAKLPVQTIAEEESDSAIKDPAIQPIVTKNQGGEHWPWNEQELDYLYKHKNDSNISIANALGRSISSVATKKSNLKLGHKRSVWTTKELDILKNAKDKNLFDLAKELPNHTFEAIRTKLSKLGLEYKHIR